MRGISVVRPELVIFDCDGVLIDSEVLSFQALRQTLVSYGIDFPQEEWSKITGSSEAATKALIESTYNIKFPPQYLTEKRARTKQLFEEKLQKTAGIAELLTHLSLNKCVASGSSPERLKHSLKLVGLWDFFAPHIFSATQVENGKPAPDLFFFAAAKMQTRPEQCLVIEDSVKGVMAGRAAGMRVYGFAGGSHCDAGHGARLRDAGAEEVFMHMDDLAKALQASPPL